MNNFILKKATYYYYQMLSGNEQEAYRIVLHALLHMKDAVTFSVPVSTEQMKKINRYVLYDRPDIFWYRGSCTLTLSAKKVISVAFKYTYALSVTQKLIRDIKSSAFYKEICTKLSQAPSDFDKALIAYEYIIKTAEYDSVAAKYDQDSRYDYAYGIEGVVLKSSAVCAGYSKAFQYFMNKFGVVCTYVVGDTVRCPHAWNLICLSGEYYYVDTTWGDPVFANGGKKDPGYISYDYFCVTSAQLKESHQFVLEDRLPLCTATKYNYYHYYDMIESTYSVERIAIQIINTCKRGKTDVIILFASKSLYNHAIMCLFEKSEVWKALELATRYVSGIDQEKIKYFVDDEKRKLIIKL